MQDLNQKIILNILAFYLIDIFPGNSISITTFCWAELYSSKSSETTSDTPQTYSSVKEKWWQSDNKAR